MLYCRLVRGFRAKYRLYYKTEFAFYNKARRFYEKFIACLQAACCDLDAHSIAALVLGRTMERFLN